jgi:hypothetical protein
VLQRLPTGSTVLQSFLAEGLDEILTANRLQLPPELRRSLACTNSIENVQGTIRRVGRNAKRWRPRLDGTAVGRRRMMEARAGFRRPKAHRQLPALGAPITIPHLESTG